jgi:hypothetical protein
MPHWFKVIEKIVTSYESTFQLVHHYVDKKLTVITKVELAHSVLRSGS